MKKGLLIFIFSSLLFCTLYAQDFQNYYSVETITLDDGSQIDKVIISGPPNPPEGYKPQIAYPTDASVTLSDVPAFDWSFGCSATSAAMQAGYFDRTGYPNMYTGPGGSPSGVMPMDNSEWPDWHDGYAWRHQCPLSATHNGLDGRIIFGHVDDYWIAYGSTAPDPFIGNWIEHTYGDCTGDYMKTNQSNYSNTDASTTFWNYTSGAPIYYYDLEALGSGYYDHDGGYGLKLFYESRGYTVTNMYNQYRQGYGTNPSLGFTYDQYKAEIDAGRPVVIHVEGHTMLGYGYDDTTSNLMYIHDTWDYNSHTMIWGNPYSGMPHTGVTIVTVETMQTVSTPTFLPSAGTYGTTQNVTISCATSGAIIYYTADGTNPTTSSNLYSTPVSISSSQTLKARAFHTLWDPSSIASGDYWIIPDPSTIDITSGTITQTQVGLNWSGSSPEFRVVRTTGGPASTPTSGTLVFEGASTSATASSLTANTTYFFTVFGKESGASQYSNGNQYLCVVTEAASGATTASVPMGQTGEITFGTTGSVVNITTNVDPDGGTIDSQKFDTAPSGNNTISGSATAPDLTTVTPNIYASERYWTISSTLTGSNAFTVYFDISGLSGVNDPDKLLILKRDTGGWEAQNTSRDGNMLYSDITSFSDFIIGADSGDNPLPVTLSSFTAVYYNRTPIINWTTQSESNNSGWNIYRSASSNAGQCQQINFELIPGAGTASEPTEYSFIDEYETEFNQTYWYWLESVSGSGETETFGPVTLTIPFEEENTNIIPVQTKLWQNYPNPFNPTTCIKFDVKENEVALLTIFNVKGQIILSQEFEAGCHYYNWDARNYSSGIYLYKLQSPSYPQIKKMILVK